MFLNPDRISPADFDIDFCKRRRGEVIEYVRNKYAGVSQIGTYGTLKLKSAIKDITRALGYSIDLSNEMCNLVSDAEGTFESELEDNQEFLDMYNKSEEAAIVVNYGKKMLGIKKSMSKHACGVIIADYDISTVVPTMLALDTETGHKNECTQLDAPECEALGLLKMDFLGLKTLTICSDAIDNIREDNEFPLLDDIPFYDKQAYELISSGETDCIFQLESAGMKEVCMQVKPDNLEELSDILALYRPGPMQYIPEYVECKNGKEVEYIHPAMKEVAGNTYGLLIYQEQIIQLVQKIAGLSLAQADILRRAIGKKKEDLLIQQEEAFKDGAEANGVTKLQRDVIWDDILKFADYGFNKCLHPDTTVTTENGDKVTIRDVEIGTMIESPSGLTEVVNKYDNGVQEVYEITLENGATIKCTMTHKFECEDGVVRDLRLIISNNYKIMCK